ncbi:MAG: zinc ribbon domain-containing protein [Eubacterium sp.]|nr:zinc ribbon domain-containing protein [Eubacterium sp.]
MYCKNCGNEINENQAICLNCGVKNGVGDKYCCHCGKEINPNAEVCLNCGMAIRKTTVSNTSVSTNNVSTKEEAFKKLAEYEKTAAIIWFVIAAVQIIGGMFTYFTPVLVGLWNIYIGVSRMKYSKSLSEMPDGVYENFEKQGTSNIIFLIVNIVLGGLIGGIALGFDIYIRKFVMDNEEYFK